MFRKSPVAVRYSAPVVMTDAITTKKESYPKWNSSANTLFGSGVRFCPKWKNSSIAGLCSGVTVEGRATGRTGSDVNIGLSW